jgi:hypothetical protein
MRLGIYSLNHVNMNEMQINEILAGQQLFGGVLARDQLPGLVKIKPKFYIVNTDPIDQPGKHWISVNIDETSEFFDSLGRKPSYYGEEFEYFIINNSNDGVYKYNSRRLQNYDSAMCGQFCIYYCLLRNANHTFDEIVNSFHDKHLSKNDEIVSHFYEKIKIV